MAKRAIQKRIPPRAKNHNVEEKPQELALRIVFVPAEDGPTYYVNHLEISHNQHNFCVYVAEIPTKFPEYTLETAKKTGQVNLTPMFCLTMPPTIIPGLIRALETQKGLYENRFGKIIDPGREGADNG